MNEEVRITPLGVVIASFIGLIFLIGLAELGLRLFQPHWRDYDSARFMEPFTQSGRPGMTIGRAGFDGGFAQNNGDFRHSIRINEFGLRNDEPVTAANGRIWILGDSMSFGWGVEAKDRYGDKLGAALGQPTYNIGAPGADVCGYQTLLARMPKEFKPQGVVLGLVLENDSLLNYDCSSKAPPAVASSEAPTQLSPLGYALGWTKGNLTQKSALYNTAVPALKRVRWVNDLFLAMGLIKPEHGYKRFFGDNEVEAVAKSTVGAIAGVRHLLPAEVPLIVLVIPARFEIRDGDPIYRALRLAVIEELNKLGIANVDPFAGFKAAGFAPTHFLHDGHWSPLGHEIAAGALTEWFKTRK
jgi:hypothetical protein